jgi:hypothetical protein
MPEVGGGLESVGYLIAAAAVTVVVLVGYSVLLTQRLRAARARNEQLSQGPRQ